MIWNEPVRGSLPDHSFLSLAGIDRARSPGPPTAGLASRTASPTAVAVEVKTTGDGFLATFDSPARALQCAKGIRDAVRHLGLEVRAGVQDRRVRGQPG